MGRAKELLADAQEKRIKLEDMEAIDSSDSSQSDLFDAVRPAAQLESSLFGGEMRLVTSQNDWNILEQWKGFGHPPILSNISKYVGLDLCGTRWCWAVDNWWLILYQVERQMVHSRSIATWLRSSSTNLVFRSFCKVVR